MLIGQRPRKDLMTNDYIDTAEQRRDLDALGITGALRALAETSILTYEMTVRVHEHAQTMALIITINEEELDERLSPVIGMMLDKHAAFLEEVSSKMCEIMQTISDGYG